MSRFDKIKEYLSRMRNAEYKILEETECLLQFTVKTKWAEKMFTVHYSDGNINDVFSDRPMWHHYYLQFDQENVPCRGQFVAVLEWKWYIDEDSALYRIKTLKNRYNY